MAELLSNFYKIKKRVQIYLETDEDIRKLREQAREKAILITEDRNNIKSSWNSKNRQYIIWTYQTNQDERWVVVVLDTIKKTATIHTATLSEQAQKEEKEVVGFLEYLPDLQLPPKLDTDTKNWPSSDTEAIAILYITKLLKRIIKGGEISSISISSFEEEKENKGGKSGLTIVKEKLEALRVKKVGLPNIDTIPTKPIIPITPFTFGKKTIPQIKEEIEKLLRDTRTKWQTYINYIDPTNINARMFADFVPIAQQLLIFINNALESPRELVDYQKLNLEWGNMSENYDQKRDYLNAWYTFRILLNQWEELSKKPVKIKAPVITEAEKQKLREYEQLKRDKEKAEEEKTKLELENSKLRTKPPAKENRPPLQRKYSWETPPLHETLAKDIQEKINLAYNSKSYLQGYYKSLLNVFLNWEDIGNEAQKEAIRQTKSNINKCLNYLNSQNQTIKIESS